MEHRLPAVEAHAPPQLVEFDTAHWADLPLATRYQAVRQFTEWLCAPLEVEDYVVQSMPDVSPTRWHLAHTTWFFEMFVLLKALPRFRAYNDEYAHLFNSYYNLVGPQFPRPRRGLMTRPTVREVFAYRAHVDEHMQKLLAGFDAAEDPQLARVIETGLHHEQQHQELMLTDLKHVFSCNPLFPVYRPHAIGPSAAPPALGWLEYGAGLCEIGYEGHGFHYDNEGPRHRVFVEPFALANRLVTCGEYLEFIRAGGYRQPQHWLSDGWATVQREGWRAPLYWEQQDGQWWQFTLSGLRPVEPHEPVCHISQYEADAYARWAGARLPTEAEWEIAASGAALQGNFVESAAFHPVPASDGGGALQQVFGDVWEWTGSPYIGYPGYQPAEGALGEYNGKFMSGQMVLRGGSCATSRTHIRRTYRNFFVPAARWQFSGLRLGRNR